jgi:uncharacterized protein YacL
MFMNIIYIRILVIIVGICLGCFLFGMTDVLSLTKGAVIGLAVAIVILITENYLKICRLKTLIGGGLGLFFGVVVSNLILYALPTKDLFSISPIPLRLFASFIFGYLGMMWGVKTISEINVQNIKALFTNTASEENLKILDTSAIIDGRIEDISETGFLEGTLIIPQFVLKELQHIADSSDSLKRNRGRRGLDILHKLQKNVDISVQIVEKDFPGIKEVDAKLVELGKFQNAKIITNDFNLNKVAELQGVQVLNVNKLANALKPVVLPGEIMSVYIIKEGKEYGQGVAYLDDGTMVVIDNARNSIGQNVEVSVTSVLQTTAGRMIFGRIKEDSEDSSVHY